MPKFSLVILFEIAIVFSYFNLTAFDDGKLDLKCFLLILLSHSLINLVHFFSNQIKKLLIY